MGDPTVWNARSKPRTQPGLGLVTKADVDPLHAFALRGVLAESLAENGASYRTL
jgi:hypothetical protein